MQKRISLWTIVMAVLSLSELNAATLSFQQGDLRLDGSPVGLAGSYNAPAVMIRRNQAGTNQNTDGRLIAGSNFSTGGPLRTMLSFDLSELNTQKGIDVLSIDSVSLRLRAIDGNRTVDRPLLTLDVHQYDFSFSETANSWNSPGAGDSAPGGTPGTQLTSLTFDPQVYNLYRSFDDTEAFRLAVRNALSSPSQTLNLLIKDNIELLGSSGDPRGYAVFSADEDTTLDFRPELIVNFTVSELMVPEPSAGMLLVSGLAMLQMVRRRKAQAGQRTGNQA